MSERALQSSLFDFYRVALPPDAVPFAIPNGDGQRSTAPGTLPGFPDTGIIYRGRLILIELKRPASNIGGVKKRAGRISHEQRETHLRLAAAGAVVATCYSVQEVQDLLSQMMPLRARLAA